MDESESVFLVVCVVLVRDSGRTASIPIGKLSKGIANEKMSYNVLYGVIKCYCKTLHLIALMML